MKKSITIYTILITILMSSSVYAQRFEKLDRIPHDIAYYRESKITKPLLKVLYGRPSIESNEEAFGNVIPFNEIWRTGANEATEVKLYDDVVFGGEIVKAGTYVLYTIPNENEWEIILSSNTDVLGAFQYDSIFDVARIKVPVSKAENLETFSIAFKKIQKNTIAMVLGWSSTRIKIPIKTINTEDNVFADNTKPVKLLKKF